MSSSPTRSHFPESTRLHRSSAFLGSHLRTNNTTAFWTHPLVAYELHLDLDPRTQRPLTQTFPVATSFRHLQFGSPPTAVQKAAFKVRDTPLSHILVSQLLFPRMFWIISASKLFSTLQIHLTAWQTLGRSRELCLSRAFFIYWAPQSKTRHAF